MEKTPFDAVETGEAVRHSEHPESVHGAPRLKAASRTRAAAMPVVSQRATAKLMKAAQACGVANYEIIFEMTGQVRLAVGVGKPNVEGYRSGRPNDFDSEFG